MSLAVRVLAIAAMLMSGSAVHAATLAYAVNGGTFSDGGTFSGSVTLDPASGNPTDWNVSVAGGGGFFPARTYTPANSSGSSQVLLGGTQPTIFLAASDEPNRELRLTPVAPLDGSASNVNIDVAFGNGNVECFNCSPFRPITAGAFALTSANPSVTLVSASPNPSTVGVSTTVTVSVSGVAALGAPTGTVTVLDSSSNPICTVTLPGTTCTFTPSAAGTVNLLAQYNGDANYATTLSGTLPLDVAAVPVPPAAPTPVPALGIEALVLLVLAIGASASLRARRG